MISHITLGVRRIDRATEFYDDVLGALGYQRSHSGNGFAGYGWEPKASFGSVCHTTAIARQSEMAPM
ncbi:MAG: hypothetical protein OEU36_21020 [Gammaproteobacteria bacterium]|nr:hypothetical protein [Gammaproteobacteria bacterium]